MYPAGRALQAPGCEAEKAGATRARDSIRECLTSVNLSPVANAKQVKRALRKVELVDDSIIPNPQPEGIHSRQASMRKPIQHGAEPINPGFDSSLNKCRKFEKIIVEIPGVDLKRSTHLPASGWWTRE